MLRRVVMCVLCASCAGPPYVAKDGTVVFPEPGARGASVLTANGVEFRDRDDIPPRMVRQTTDEPWKPPVGFILPKNGRFTQTSKPTLVATSGLAFALRPSDERVPSWGGEVLVRVDIIAPAPLGMARNGELIAIIADGAGIDTLVLADTALDQLGAYDKVMAIDGSDGRVIVPLIPANHRSLTSAALEKRMRTTIRVISNLAAALRTAQDNLGVAGVRRVLVLTDGRQEPTPAAISQVKQLAAAGFQVSVIGTKAGVLPSRAMAYAAGDGIVHTGEDLESRTRAVKSAIPAAGQVVFRDAVLSFAGNPAPSHVLETSGGGVRWRVDSGELVLGDVIAGEARTEVIRVTVPPWVPGQRFTFEVTAHARDVLGNDRTFHADILCTYDDDIERIAETRFGDVIAYASALATLKRLDGAFVGNDVDRVGGIWAIAKMHAESMTLLARDTNDHAIKEQADVLNALFAVTDH